MKMNGEDLSVLKEKKTKKTLLKIIIWFHFKNKEKFI